MQNITVDLNNLLGSIENLVPLVSTYLAAVEIKEGAQISNNNQQNNYNNTYNNNSNYASSNYNNSYQNNYNNNVGNATRPQTIIAEPVQETPIQPNQTQSTPNMNMNKQPRPADITQLLENPFVKNILTNFLQNTNKPQ